MKTIFPKVHGFAFTFVCTLMIAPSVSEELAVPLISSTVEITQVPERGVLMPVVEEKYGSPDSRSNAVGEPPITAWHYSGFVVYFENERVLHSVIKN
jgi:hypothetical protein